MYRTSPLWTCPKCGARFVTQNMFHGCAPFTAEQFLAGKGPKALALYQRMVELIGLCGPFEVHATKSRIAFMDRVRFAGISNLSDRGMTVGFWLKRGIESSRFSRVEKLTPPDHIYYFRVSSVEELDSEVLDWLREA